jgi:hypothetical protein
MECDLIINRIKLLVLPKEHLTHSLYSISIQFYYVLILFYTILLFISIPFHSITFYSILLNNSFVSFLNLIFQQF